MTTMSQLKEEMESVRNAESGVVVLEPTSVDDSSQHDVVASICPPAVRCDSSHSTLILGGRYRSDSLSTNSSSHNTSNYDVADLPTVNTSLTSVIDENEDSIDVNSLDKFEIFDITFDDPEAFDIELNHHHTNDSLGGMVESTGANVRGNLNDVLLGKGGATNRNPGNVLFRARADDLRAKYKATKLKKKKQEIQQQLIDMTKAGGARFIKIDGATEIEVPDNVAMNKASQVLREGPEVGMAKREKIKAKKRCEC
jgi:hypothetical protein